MKYVPSNENHKLSIDFYINNTDSGLLLKYPLLDPLSLSIVTNLFDRKYITYLSLNGMDISKLPMGNYSIISVLGGRDADKYQIEHLKNINGAIFKVLDKWSAIPAPYIVSVELIYDYTAVYIVFSAPTNMANLDMQFPCIELFEFAMAIGYGMLVRYRPGKPG